MRNPFRYFNSSPEVIRLVVMMYVRYPLSLRNVKPVPFAVRTPLVDLKETDRLGWGVAIWFGCDDADALHDHLIEHGTPIVFAPKDGPFGRYFAFRDPFGYTITPHTVAQS
jgi:hypothetical protein